MPTTTDTPNIDHRDGCPATRIEESRPTRPNGERLIVHRCIECGESVVRKDTSDG